MLVLTRKREQRIKIGAAVTVTVVAINGSQVRLGIEAPPAWKIQRHEEMATGIDQGGWPHDFERAGVIAGEMQLAMAKGEWARFHELAKCARERLTDETMSLTDVVGVWVAHKLERAGIFTLDELAKRDSRELLHTTDGLGRVAMDRLNSALVEHLGIVGWWEE